MKYLLSGLNEEAWRGEKFTLNLVVRAKPISKIFRFVNNRGYWKMIIPQEVAREMGIDEDTHYLIFYSPEALEMIILLIPFSYLLKFYRFTLPGGEDEEEENEKAEEENIGGKMGLLYKLHLYGQMNTVIRKVWKSWSKRAKKSYYGISIPPEVAEALKIRDSTIYLMLYSKEANIIILELRNTAMDWVKTLEKMPQKEKIADNV